MSKRKIEVFTAGCPACEPVVEMVHSMACPSCDITIHDVAVSKVHELVKNYNITSLPSVAVDGKLVSCCEGASPCHEELQRAGIGKPN